MMLGVPLFFVRRVSATSGFCLPSTLILSLSGLTTPNLLLFGILFRSPKPVFRPVGVCGGNLTLFFLKSSFPLVLVQNSHRFFITVFSPGRDCWLVLATAVHPPSHLIDTIRCRSHCVKPISHGPGTLALLDSALDGLVPPPREDDGPSLFEDLETDFSMSQLFPKSRGFRQLTFQDYTSTSPPPRFFQLVHVKFPFDPLVPFDKGRY